MKPESLTFNDVDLFSWEAAEYKNEWVNALNKLNFQEVNLDISLDRPETVNILTELHNINDITLRIDIIKDSEIPKQIIDRFQIVSNVQVNVLFLAFINGYEAGFFKEFYKWPKRPSKIVATMTFSQLILEEGRAFDKDKLELRSAGFNIF